MRLELKLQPRAYAYMRYRYGERLSLPMADEGASFLYFAIRQGKRISKAFQDRNPSDQSTYTHTYIVELKQWAFFQTGITDISMEAMIHINAYFKEQFKKAFYLRLMELMYVKQPRMKMIQAIYYIMEEWKMDDDLLTADALKKDFYRYKLKHPEIFKKTAFDFVPFVPTGKSNDAEVLKLRVDDELKNKFKKACNKQKLNMSQVLHCMIEKYVSNV